MERPDDFYREFGRLLQRTRERAPGSLTQQAVADQVGLSRASIANLEQGRQRPQLHTLVKLAETLDVSPADLIPDLRAASVQRQAVEALEEKGAPQSLIEQFLAHLEEEGEFDEPAQS